jgi:Domain of unknown function (DUF4281)
MAKRLLVFLCPISPFLVCAHNSWQKARKALTIGGRMTPDVAFSIANSIVLLFWALLILAPRWAVTRALCHMPWVPLALAVVYAVYAVPGFFPGRGPDGGGFGSLSEVMILFTSPTAVLAGWVHYLVFDLFVGAWESRDAERLGISHWMVAPCLALTLLLGPLGLACYLTLRWVIKRRLSLQEIAHA